MAIVNVFHRISAKGKPYFTASLVCEDGTFEDLGFVALSRTTGAKAAWDEIDKAGLLKEGSTDKGAYKMLSMALDLDTDVKVVKGIQVITDFRPLI